jgi:hypothetical protein
LPARLQVEPKNHAEETNAKPFSNKGNYEPKSSERVNLELIAIMKSSAKSCFDDLHNGKEFRGNSAEDWLRITFPDTSILSFDR